MLLHPVYDSNSQLSLLDLAYVQLKNGFNAVVYA